jgi:hypothetical protein
MAALGTTNVNAGAPDSVTVELKFKLTNNSTLRFTSCTDRALRIDRPFDKAGTAGSVAPGSTFVTRCVMVAVVAASGSGKSNVGAKPPAVGNAIATGVDGAPLDGAAGKVTVAAAAAANGACVVIGNGVATVTGGRLATRPLLPDPHAANAVALTTMSAKSTSKREANERGVKRCA